MLLALVLIAAGWEADLKIRAQGQPAPASAQGHLRVQDNKVRMEQEGAPAITLYDHDAGTIILLRAGKQTFQVRPAEGGPAEQPGPPTCPDGDVASCLQKQGFTRVGAETLDGVATVVYARRRSAGEERIWRDEALPGLVYRKQLAPVPGATLEIDFVNLRAGPQPEAQFRPPPEYKPAEPAQRRRRR